MDETQCYFDMVALKTIDFVGNKTIDLINSGHDKNRFTVVLTTAADGSILKAMIIFRNLKKVPKCVVPDNCYVAVNTSGTMDRDLMIGYIDNVVVPYLEDREGI